MGNAKDFANIHETYKKSLFLLEVDLRFWQHFITQWAIPEYQKQFGPRLMNSAGYGTYDNSPFLPSGYFKMSDDIHEIHSQDLTDHSDRLFNWVMNLSLVRAYNSLEILILQAINVAFLHLPVKNLTSKKEMNQVHGEIIKSLTVPSSRNNNAHLIHFLKEKSPQFASWVQLKMRIDLDTTWDDFFYLTSVLRHTIVHQAMILHTDILNDIRSKSCRGLFDRHFTLSDAGNKTFELEPVQELFNNYLAHTIEFSVNTLKFISGEKDLKFLSLA